VVQILIHSINLDSKNSLNAQWKQKELTASRKETKSNHTFVTTLNEFSVKIKISKLFVLV